MPETQKATTRKKLPFDARIRRRLRKVRDAILAEPKAYNQSQWGPAERCLAEENAQPSCGTPACIAGWFYHFTPEAERVPANPETTMYKALGVVTDSIVDSRAYGWPEPFATQFQRLSSRQRVKLARVAAARIDHLLATGE